MTSLLQVETYIKLTKISIKYYKFYDRIIHSFLLAGPGDYDPILPAVIIGGVMPRAGSTPASILPPPASPGPGSYNLDSRPKTTGTIPFQGRGKMETDLLIASAKLQPGPGYYDLPEKPARGGRIPAARVPSGIETLLRLKSALPGMSVHLDDNIV